MSADSTLIGENVRPQIGARDLVVRDLLEEGPPLRVEKNLVLDPVRNGLLGDAGVPGLAQPRRKRGLRASGNFDRAIERSNVRFIHGTEEYTRILVSVNKNHCLTSNKEVCKVLAMPTTKRKTEPKRQKLAEPAIGQDGLTFSQRVRRLMSEQSPPLGQSELARLCSEYYATFMPREEEKVKQQHVFNLLRGQGSVEYLPLLAAVFDVNEMWLQYGIGPKERNQRH